MTDHKKFPVYQRATVYHMLDCAGLNWICKTRNGKMLMSRTRISKTRVSKTKTIRTRLELKDHFIAKEGYQLHV